VVRRASLAVLVVVPLLGACVSGTQPDTGAASALSVQGGQYFNGPMPAAQNGPAVTDVETRADTVRAGQIGFGVAGRLAQGAHAVALTLQGDPGYWVLPGGLEDLDFPGQVDYSAKLSFAPSLPPGPTNLTLRAVDGAGEFGPPSTLVLTVGGNAPTGALVVTLTWDTESDLDLHLVDPNGTVIWTRHPTSIVLPPPGSFDAGVPNQPVGILDRDSNGACVIDGYRQEDVVFQLEPPKGHYTVRVDAFSMCSQPVANWHASVIHDGVPGPSAEGTMGPNDTITSHDANAGLTVFAFDVE
jgi:hypothetical protein